MVVLVPSVKVNSMLFIDVNFVMMLESNYTVSYHQLLWNANITSSCTLPSPAEGRGKFDNMGERDELGGNKGIKR